MGDKPAATVILAQDEKLGSLQIGKYLAILSTHQPGLLREKHTHEETHVIFIRKGKVTYTVNGDARELGPGDVIIIPAGTAHSSEVLGDTPCHVMCLVLV